MVISARKSSAVHHISNRITGLSPTAPEMPRTTKQALPGAEQRTHHSISNSPQASKHKPTDTIIHWTRYYGFGVLGGKCNNHHIAQKPAVNLHLQLRLVRLNRPVFSIMRMRMVRILGHHGADDRCGKIPLERSVHPFDHRHTSTHAHNLSQHTEIRTQITQITTHIFHLTWFYPDSFYFFTLKLC